MPQRILAMDAHERTREVAFALVLRSGGQPVPPDRVAEAAGGGSVGPMLDELARAGWIDRDAEGRVTGSAGLSISDGPHRLRLDAHDFRTWCAYDALGIPAALGTNAHIDTTCGECGAPIALPIVDGRPARSGPEVLWFAAGGTDLRASFCNPTVLLCGAEHGLAWAERQGNAGVLLALDAAASQGATEWASCAESADRMAGTAVEYVDGPRGSEREVRQDTPPTIDAEGGRYNRSVRCADDSALRYVWRSSIG